MPDLHCRSSDTALVAYLKTLGYFPVNIQWLSGTCYWFFTKVPEISAAVEVFLAGKAVVEPGLYNRYFGETKRELYDRRSLADVI